MERPTPIHGYETFSVILSHSHALACIHSACSFPLTKEDSVCRHTSEWGGDGSMCHIMRPVTCKSVLSDILMHVVECKSAWNDTHPSMDMRHSQ